MEEDPCQRRIVFTDAANEGLAKCVGDEARRSKSKFYADTESFKAAVAEVRRIGRLHILCYCGDGCIACKDIVAVVIVSAAADDDHGISPSACCLRTLLCGKLMRHFF